MTDYNTNPVTTNQACPVLQEAQHVLEVSHDLRKAMRRLQKKLGHCAECEKEGDCVALKYFQDQIRAAIAEIAETWV